MNVTKKCLGALPVGKLLATSVTVTCLLGLPVSAFAFAWNDTETREYEHYLDKSPYYNETPTSRDYDVPSSPQVSYQRKKGTRNVSPFAHAQTLSLHRQVWDFTSTAPENRAGFRQNNQPVYDQAGVYDQAPTNRSILVGGLSWH
jgi:hypothetical protein